MKTAEEKTAKIYTFPIRPQRRSPGHRIAQLEREAQAYGKVEFGAGWYHGEAIAEASNARKR